MAGPTFSFWYAQFTDASCAQLASIARKLARSFQCRPAQSIGGHRTLLDAELVSETMASAASGIIGIHVSSSYESRVDDSQLR